MLPGALLTGVLVWRAFSNNRTASERRLLESARVDASGLDREFAGTISILAALATSPALDRDDLEAFYLEARRVRAADRADRLRSGQRSRGRRRRGFRRALREAGDDAGAPRPDLGVRRGLQDAVVVNGAAADHRQHRPGPLQLLV